MKKVPLTIRLPMQLKKELEQMSEKKGLTLNAIVVEALWNLKK